jgi:hypothetical protein
MAKAKTTTARKKTTKRSETLTKTKPATRKKAARKETASRTKKANVPPKPGQQQADEPSTDQDPLIEVPVAEVIKAQAATLQDDAASICLAGCLGALVGTKYFPESYATYRDNMLQQCGNPTDPLVKMQIEQLALAHHNVGLLHLRAAASKHPQAAAAFSAAAARLLGEFRRGILALEEYRTRTAAHRDETVSNGQLSEPASQNGNGKANGCTAKKNGHDTELVSNGNGNLPECLKERMRYPKPAASPAV